MTRKRYDEPPEWKVYLPRPDYRWGTAAEAIEQVEDSNCAKGCPWAQDGDRAHPGGSCDLLAGLRAGRAQADIVDLGSRKLHCQRRLRPPIPEPERRSCGCLASARVISEERHQAWHELVVAQGGPAGTVNTETLRAARGDQSRSAH